MEGSLRLGKKEFAKRLGRKDPEKYMSFLKNPFFIIGCGRSGTSMLTNILEEHRDICNYSEANDIWDPKGYPWYSTNLDRPPIWYDTDKYIKVWREYFDYQLEIELKGVFGCFQSISKTDFFLNKSPMNTLRIPDILRIFPDGKIIHIIRDGRAVAYSWGKKQMKKIEENKQQFLRRGYYYPFEEIVKFSFKSWIYHLEEVEKQKKVNGLLTNNNFLEFTYEDFSEDPHYYINSISEFIGFDKKYFKTLDLSKVKNYNFKWKENLDKGLIDEMNSLLQNKSQNSNIFNKY